MKVYLYFYTDSVGFPRIENQRPEMSWPHILKDLLEKSSDITVYPYMRGLGGGTIGEIEKIFIRDSGYFKGYGEQTVSLAIFNIGIVDSAPRPFTYKLKKLTSIPKLGRLFKWFLVNVLKPNRKLFQNIYSYRETSPGKFRKTFKNMVSSCLRRNIIPISIDTPLVHKKFEERSPKLNDSIMLYNQLKHVNDIEHVSCKSIDQEYLLEDGHYFNIKGHQLIADALYIKVSSYI
jgi:hypothetical protein